MSKYTVKITTNFNTGDYDSFEIDAIDMVDAQTKATMEAFDRGYAVEDVSVEESDELEVMEAEILLGGMINCYTLLTTRGTVGDASGIITIDSDIIKTYKNGEVKNLIDLKDDSDLDSAKNRAYQDCLDFIATDCPDTTPEDYKVIILDCEYILAWD